MKGKTIVILLVAGLLLSSIFMTACQKKQPEPFKKNPDRPAVKPLTDAERFQKAIAPFKAMLDVNLLGAFYCCKAVLPIMYAKRDGNIIFVNSRSGQQGAGFRAAYCASKAGQIGLMESLAQESRAHGVRVNTITPVGVKTDMTYELRNFDGAEIDASGFMEPEEVADAALFLASHLSRGMHGQCLNLYGGTAYRHCADLRA